MKQIQLFLEALLISSICIAQTPAPKITFEKNHHDFGKVFQDQKVSFTYKLINTGTAPLQILEVIPSCGCTHVLTGKNTLLPKEESFLEVQFNPSGMVGAVHKSLEVISNDPDSPNVQLTFQAEVIQEITSTASAVQFNDIERDKSYSSNLRLKSENDSPVTVTGIRTKNAPYLSWSHRKISKDAILTITIDGNKIPNQKYYGNDILTVYTTNKTIPFLEYSIQWNIKPIIVSTPERVTWIAKRGQKLKATVTLEHTEEKSFKILGTKSSSSRIKVTKLSKISAPKQQFDVVLSAKAKTQSLNETLTVTLDDPKQKMLEIKIIAVFQ